MDATSVFSNLNPFNWFRRKPAPVVASKQGSLVVDQAALFLLQCQAGKVKDFIVVAEVTLDNGETSIATMGACSLLWGRTALSIAIAEFPITTH